MIYFYDVDKKYIGCRELKLGESVPINATVIAPIVGSGQQAHYIDGAWVVSDVPAETDIDIPARTPTADERLDVLEPEVDGIVTILEAIV